MIELMISRALIFLESSLDERICFTTACVGRSVELVNVCVDDRSLDTLGPMRRMSAGTL